MKKILSGILAAAMVMSFASVAAMAAADKAESATSVTFGTIENDDEEKIKGTGDNQVDANGLKITSETRIEPNAVIYVEITGVTFPDNANHNPDLDDLQDDKLWKFDYDKDTNGKLVKKISLLTDKKLDTGSGRHPVIKIELADTTTTSELHTDGTISFTARKDSKDNKDAKGVFLEDDEIVIDYSFWINNEKKGNDDDADEGDRVYFDPDDNDTNTLIWGDDRAALKFEADDDASKFYARLSTSVDREIYAEYGDPVDAELWFYDFVTNPTIPSTSRATLTLGIPWDDDDDDYIPDPESCFIYEKDADGNLTDVTDKFTFSEDDEEIPGWSMKTRVLGTYVLSDTELDIEAINADDEDDDDAAADVTTPDGGKDIPQTGSSDMVNVAVVAAVVSLTAAGAVAFRKVK
ncbi:hypothetical protein [Anaerotruncus rubiinfantis]|uniref:hypothetical protein n=1 Tax=Anaerotruncus rubiinfantis TaxID=1720200 RepID=UPI00189706E2|nr:hypothetical protein [Anaerotruncus rubiinfantis]